MDWTQQQKDAIRTDGRSIIVSAAAGSGKTAVLVERLLRILSDPVRRVQAESLVVVTYTTDAAAQMKQRLMNKLTEALEQSESGDPETYDWLLQQRAGLNSAHICTIHSFCFDLIREHAEDCGVSPLFAIAEPSQERIYQQQALQRVMEEWSTRPELETLFCGLCAREESELERLILETAAYMHTMPFRRDWVRRAIALSQDKAAFFAICRDAACDAIRDVIRMIREGEPLAEALHPSAPVNRYLEKLRSDIAALEDHITFLQAASPEELIAAPDKGSAKFLSFPSARKAEQVDPEDRDELKRFCTIYSGHYKKHVLTARLGMLRYFEEDAAEQKKLVPLLLTLTEDYLDALFAEKCARNVLGFSDAEELALSLLGHIDENGCLHRTALAETLSRQTSLIMVDEYQDSNNKQDCLFKLLSRDCRVEGGELYYGSNAFLVGDVKQSIYSFRQANPENFRRVIRESTPLEACTGEELALIYLNQNFRSARGVLRFVNALFRAVMTEDCGEVAYDDREQLNFGCPVYKDTPEIPTVVLLPQPEKEPEFGVQADCIADTILHMLRSGAPVYEAEGARPCRPEDFCILLRSVSGDGRPIVDALEHRGIPVASDDDDKLLALPEICLIRDLLRIIDNPMLDTAMAAVLLSPVCGFSAEELAQLKLTGKRRIYLQLRAAAAEETALGQRSADLLALLRSLRDRAEQVELERFIREVFDATDLLSLQGLYENSENRRAHLELFVQEAQRYRENADLSAEGDLSGWLRFLDRLTEAKKDIEIKAAPAATGCVFLKTIHKSKGLEYPFVFAANLEHKFNTRSDLTAALHASQEGLIGLQLCDRANLRKATSLGFKHLLANKQNSQKSEELRLFYVELTRARQQLFLVLDRIYPGMVKSATSICNIGRMIRLAPGIASVMAPQAACMQHWVLYFLYGSADSELFLHAMEHGEGGMGQLAEYRVWKQPAEQQTLLENRQEVHAAADPALLAQMKQQTAFVYTSPLTTLMSKYSVTQLSAPGAAAAELTHTPRFAGEESRQKLKGTARGSAIHKIMQFLDLRAAAAAPEEAVAALLREGQITQTEAEALDPAELRMFLESDLCRRILEAQTVLREHQFFVRIGELELPEGSALAAQYAGTEGMLIGTMDLLFQEADGWVLVDYKSNFVRHASELTEKYSLQLGLYQKAAELVLGMHVKEAVLYSFTLGEAIPVELDKIEY